MGAPVLELKVDGKWLRQFGAWGDLTYSFSWPGGPKEASWQMTSRYGSRLDLLRQGALVEVFWAGGRQWIGELSEPAWNGDEVSLTADGAFRRGERYKALDGLNAPTSNAAAAVFYSGIWAADASVPNGPLPGDPPQDINTVTDVMNAWAEQLGCRWQVDQNLVASMAYDPITPTYLIRQGSGDMGIASDAYASHVGVWHISAATSAMRLAVYPAPLRGGTPNAYEKTYGHSESVLKITDRGPIPDADADQLAQSVYTRTMQHPQFTNGLQLGYGEILNHGWRPIHPAAVRPNRMAWKLGTPDEVALTPHTPFVIGETVYKDGEDTVTVNPVNLASRTQEDVLTELLEAMSGAVV